MPKLHYSPRVSQRQKLHGPAGGNDSTTIVSIISMLTAIPMADSVMPNVGRH